MFEDFDRFIGRYALGFERGKGSSHFLRIKVKAAELSADQARAIADLAESFSRGYLELTTRHDIQLHWIRDEDAPRIFSRLEELGFTTDMCGQAYPGARYGDVRNVVTCPLSGVMKGELIDVRPVARGLVDFFTGRAEYLDLPRKFKISVSGCPVNCVKPEIHDLSFVATRAESGHVHFAIFVGGGVGYPPMLAEPIGTLSSCGVGDAVEVARGLVELFRDKGQRENKQRARFKWMVRELGALKIVEELERRTGIHLEPPNLEPPLNWGEHIGTHAQKQPGLYYVVVPVLLGRLTSEQLRMIADLADAHGSGELRISPLQKLIVVNVPERELHQLRRGLSETGFDLDAPSIKWTTVACSGGFCGKSPEDPKSRALEIADHLGGTVGDLTAGNLLRVRVSGCPNSCAQSHIAEIGLVGTRVTREGRTCAAYDIYVGDGKGSKISNLYKRGVPADLVKYEVEELVRSLYWRTSVGGGG